MTFHHLPVLGCPGGALLSLWPEEENDGPQGVRPLPPQGKNRRVPLVRGFDDEFLAPHSRHTEVAAEDIHACDALTILAESEEAGVFYAWLWTAARSLSWDIRSMIV